jgi:pancreatic triacylglycerol lipase
MKYYELNFLIYLSFIFIKFVCCEEISGLNDTYFNLYNRLDNNAFKITNKYSLLKSECKLDPLLDVIIIIHGYLSKSGDDWVIEAKNEILKHDNVNVITVDWSYLSFSSYLLVLSNYKNISNKIIELINFTIEHKDSQPFNFYLIGFSIGSHIAGYVGHKIKGLKRITGLDPAWIGLKDAQLIDRLDSNDALFVDVIHTDRSSNIGLGFRNSLGHVDFYPNDGKNQPGCKKSIEKVVETFMKFRKIE